MKKLTAFILCLVFLLSTLPAGAKAYRTGDVVGFALTTDIAAMINGYDIPSYNVDGYTYIVAEDLKYYGFSVNYDNSSRSLTVSRDLTQEWVSKKYTKPYVSSSKVGQRAHSILYTDIKTYFDGSYVESYNIDGLTIIKFDALNTYGAVSYDNNKREISLNLSGLNLNPSPVNRAAQKMAADIIGCYRIPGKGTYSVVISEYDGEKISFEITAIRSDGNRIAGAYISEYMSAGVCYFNYEDTYGSYGSGILSIIDKNTVKLDFEEPKGGALWSIATAEGTHLRYSDLPADYKPWSLDF